jgi:uncharacterized protein (TIGR00255 family)
MLRSMTGFGSAAGEGGGYSFQVEVRSVNHRHLLVKTRLTSDFSHLEGDVEVLVRKRLERGSVTVGMSVARVTDSQPLAVDPAVAESYHADIVALAERLGIAPTVSMDTLLGLPGVVSAADNDAADPRTLRRAVLGAVEEALDRLVEMRQAEGRAIDADLAKHRAATDRILRRIEKRMPTVVRTHQKNLEKRVRELVDERHAVQSGDVAREVALLADRLDVSEEVARLSSHLEQLGGLLEKGGRVGRKLDFLVQEIFREVNTIGSKCSDSKIAHWVVEAKTHVERLREQVQNVE